MRGNNMPRHTSPFLFALLASAATLLSVGDALVVDGLQVGFYGKTCPAAEGVISDIVNNEIAMDRGISPGLIRLTELFSQRGLSQEDLVLLSGAHSIGGAHCFMFSNRIYNFSQDADVDPTLDPEYAKWLRQMCPPRQPGDDPEQAPKVKFDAQTGERLDVAYYSELLARRGLLTSDNALIEDPQTRAMVENFARNEPLWQQKFSQAMQKVGMLDVLIGEGKGQVRKQCRLVNGQEKEEKQQQPQEEQEEQQPPELEEEEQQQPHQPQLPWFLQRQRPPVLLPWLRPHPRPRRPFRKHPVADLVNGFFRGFH
ncbi:Peroxidase 64 [Zea mays]|uniref:peroxidase n=1 Tax=Zea mays TaxID=4577 RepID=A0A1D6LTN6_MAIZE|nr:Peroxidase 64 [Zea mays]